MADREWTVFLTISEINDLDELQTVIYSCRDDSIPYIDNAYIIFSNPSNLKSS